MDDSLVGEWASLVKFKQTTSLAQTLNSRMLTAFFRSESLKITWEGLPNWESWEYAGSALLPFSFS